MKKKVLKRTGIALLTVVALAVVIAGGYVAYLFATYSRLEDNLSLEIHESVLFNRYRKD